MNTAQSPVAERLESSAEVEAGLPEISVVMPCLNEADTLEICLRKALSAFEKHGIRGEVVVADNGSTDGSREIALRMGVRVVDVKLKGYGNALMGGIEAARGKYVLMGDADDSYDFQEIPKFVEQLRKGAELVQGCRLPSGGGTVSKGAMPWSHRWIGNPMFSFLARNWFGAPIHDVYCGMRGFTKTLYDRLNLRCTGMEFATEMVIKASLFRARIAEVPITLHKDGRVAHPPHLRTMRDGWRTLRFFMIYSPRWLFLIPGLFLMLLGLVGYGLAMPATKVLGVTLDAHTLLVASLAILCGYQAVLFALFTKLFAISEGLMPEDRRLKAFYRWVSLETGLLAGALAFLLGLMLIAAAVLQWHRANYGPLDYAHTMRWVIPGTTLAVLGFQTALGSFFISVLGMRRR
ncbi:dolichol-P-glucose synthetase [Verrucomicrobia bacterium LW23]|nr:dolichol-P-glucose synthetase [Verrucomicrobia bacterium LW23]